MGLLQNTVKECTIESLSVFELGVWNTLCSLFRNLLEDELSDESIIEKGMGIDVFLKLKRVDFVIYISFTENNLYINSKYFDIYVYPEIESDKIEFLLREILLGRYSIILGFGDRDKLLYEEFVFDSQKLKEFNEKGKVGFFKKKVVYEKKIKGFKLIRS